MKEHNGRRIRAGLVIGLLLLLATALFIRPAGAALTGFHIRDGKLYDGNDQGFVMRGINHAYAWYPQQNSSFANIKAAGANTVRVVLSNGDRWTRTSATDVAAIIKLCKDNRLICVLEVHDTTGYGEDSAATTLSRAADYWIAIKDTLAGQESYVIINIGNEPYGNSNYSAWTQATKDAIVKLRGAGLAHTIMVDAPNWGQDWAFTMRDKAGEVFAADSRANLIFSIHMYGVFDTSGEVESYLKAFTNARLPIVVGEFGSNHSDGNPDEDAIMSWAQTLGVGYLGWSWSGNGGGVEYLDVVNSFNPASLTTWGQRLVNGANGLKATSREASVFGTPPATATRPPATATPRPPATATPGSGGACKVTYTITNQWNNGFTADAAIKNNGPAINGWTLTWSFANGQQITGYWNGIATQSGANVSFRNESWNGSLGSGATTSIGFQATHTGANARPTAFRLNGVLCTQ
jgi:mannan endo-1,4-beta-mannosidase